MKSKAHIGGHPIHPMLISFPFAYLSGSVCLDVWSRATGRDTFSRTASHMNGLGLGSALVAAVPGLVDYWGAIPAKTRTKQHATIHMIANLSAVGLFALARAPRRQHGAPAPAAAVAAGLAGAALLGLGGWLGGSLVYHHGMGVDDAADGGRGELVAGPRGTLME